MTTRPLRFIRRGQPVALANVPPDRTLLEVLREDLCSTGTKEGCGEGDCGACTVVLGEARDGKVHYSAVNSCIRLAHSVHGMALWTVEDLTQDPLIQPATEPAPALHPAQEAMVQCHGSQCGFCTPGFVMSLFGMYQNHICQGQSITRELAQEELSGNLCRCTGYRPILDAAQQMAALPVMAVNEAEVLQKLELLALDHKGLEADFSYISPPTLPALLAARAAHPGAQVVAGCTDVGLWVTKLHKQYAQVLDVTRAAELRVVEHTPAHIAIGAAVTLTDAFAALTAQWPQLHRFATRFAGLPVRNSGTLGGNVANGSPIGDSMPLLIALRAQVVAGCTDVGLWVTKQHKQYTQVLDVTRAAELRQVVQHPDAIHIGAAVTLTDAFAALTAQWPQLHRFATRFAGLPVRNSGTLGGNVANGSPIGDSMPLLIALGATLVLASTRGERSLPIADFYLAYRKTALVPDEVLARIDVPLPTPHEWLRADKISKRLEDDISAVCLAVALQIDGGVIRSARIGAGGVAAVPARAIQTEAALAGKPATQAVFDAAATVLAAEFEPISDMRASSAYRRTVLGNLLRRAWAQSQPGAATLATLQPETLP